MSSTEEYQQSQFWEEGHTISKSFKDDDIICRLPNGDLYLKMGVKRLKNTFTLSEDNEDEHINYDALRISKNRESAKRYQDVSYNEDQIDNWETI